MFGWEGMWNHNHSMNLKGKPATDIFLTTTAREMLNRDVGHPKASVMGILIPERRKVLVFKDAFPGV